MLIAIPDVLDATGVATVRAIIDAAAAAFGTLGGTNNSKKTD